MLKRNDKECLVSVKLQYFILALLTLSLGYLLFELFFNRYASLRIDEFWFAHVIYQYKNTFPYRDFSPYKTVLGYYLLLYSLVLKPGVFSSINICQGLDSYYKYLCVCAS